MDVQAVLPFIWFPVTLVFLDTQKCEVLIAISTSFVKLLPSSAVKRHQAM